MRRQACLAGALALALLAPVGAQAQSFELSGVTFTSSIYLEEEELQAVVLPYLGRPIRIGDVQAMVEDVQGVYTRAGILTARVMLLPQTVDDGILTLTLVEASVDDLTYGPGLEQTDAAFMRRNLSLREGAAPDYDQLERDLRIFEIMYDFAPQLTFSPGGAFGTVDAEVSGEAPETNTWVASVDNYGSENTGEYRATVQGLLPNLTGVRDSAVVQAQLSEGSVSVSGTYLRPVGGGGGVAYVSADASRSEVVTGDFSVLGLESESYGLTLGYRRPFAIRPQSHWMVDAFVTAENSTSQFTSRSFQENEIAELAVQVSYQHVGDGRAWSAALGIKSGTVDTRETSESEGDYTLLYGTAGHARTMGDDYLLDLSASFQLAPDENLASPRLFSAGGVTTVRGYPEEIRDGDSGVVLRTQFTRTTPFRLGEGSVALTPFGFLDLGLVVPFRESGVEVDWDTDLLASAGFGARASFAEDWAGVAFVSVPFQETDGFDEVGQAVLSVGIDYTF